jgi:hypothetical protein
MGILLLAGIVLCLTSPKKLRTLGRMVAAFVLTALLIMIPTSIARRGDPQMWGEMAAEIGVLIAVVAGWWHSRSLKRASQKKPEPPPTKA